MPVEEGKLRAPSPVAVEQPLQMAPPPAFADQPAKKEGGPPPLPQVKMPAQQLPPPVSASALEKLRHEAGVIQPAPVPERGARHFLGEIKRGGFGLRHVERSVAGQKALGMAGTLTAAMAKRRGVLREREEEFDEGGSGCGQQGEECFNDEGCCNDLKCEDNTCQPQEEQE